MPFFVIVGSSSRNRLRSRRAARALLPLACAASLLVAVPAVWAQAAPATQALPNAPLSTGRVTGVVTDATGALVENATVVLHSGTNNIATSSAADGSFSFGKIPAGPFTLTVSLKGFSDSTASAILGGGETLALPAITMKMAEVDVSVNALTQKELADLQIHAEEQQRVLGILPNFFVVYDPHAVSLSPRQKFSLVLASFRDPVNIGIAAVSAGVQQANNDFSGYGPGPAGYGKRFGANYGGLVIGTTLGGGVFPVLFHQDPRYFYKGTGNVHSRLLYALSSAVICHGDNGKRQPAYASVLGDFSAGAISNAYYPSTDRNGAALTLGNGLIAVGSDAVGNVFQEFVVRFFTPKSRRGVVDAVTTANQQH